MTHAALPYHLYVNVDNAHLGPNMPKGTTAGLWHGVHSREGQMLMCHVMLDTGAHWSGLPLHALSTSDVYYTPAWVMPWFAMGEHILATSLPYLEGLKANPMCEPLRSTLLSGRHTGIVIDWADGYSRYPQEHKPLNLIAMNNGPFVLLPNNYATYTDKHFTDPTKQDHLQYYRRNDQVYWE